MKIDRIKYFRILCCRIIWAAMVMSIFFASDAHSKKVVILGIDGMDPNLLKQFMSVGAMPNFSRLAAQGDFKPLQTTAAPQSPVAWSTFITGMDPGGHGIFDFVHRDPKTMLPFFSMSQAIPAGKKIEIGSWVIPLSSAKVELLRKGRAFWQILGEHGVPTTIFRMPVNFPPVKALLNKSFSGMGTPDIQGTPGTFSYYTSELPKNANEFTGGKAHHVKVINNQVTSKLYGPANPFRRVERGNIIADANQDLEQGNHSSPQCTIDFHVYIDKEARAAKFIVGENEFILKEREWSNWQRLDFEAIPWLVSISSIGRFYLKQIAPRFELYVTPLQINPEKPAMPVSSPANWSKELCACLGYFYTKELPEDTKALTYGVISGHDFQDQLLYIHGETERIYSRLLKDHKDGLLFFYFGGVDQGSHMLWRYADRKHPGYIADPFLEKGIQNIYKKMDDVLGLTLKTIDKDTVLIVMSDHGFAPFYRGVNLNTWLLENGYIELLDASMQEEVDLFSNVNWAHTRAYAMGLNGLYINLKGREKNGIVPQNEYEGLLDHLEADLLAMQDPKMKRHPVSHVTRSRRDFHGPYKDRGGDLLVGYSWGYRTSWESPLGAFPKQIFVDNLDAWSADHCMDHRLVPGILLTNQKIPLSTPSLQDLTVAVLDEFGLLPLPEMIGKDCLRPKKTRGEK